MSTQSKRIVPVFRNISEIKRTPRVPTLPYFTAAQWKRAIKGIPVRPRSAIDKKHLAIHYAAAPWGGGDMIVYPTLPFRETLQDLVRIRCSPTLDVHRTSSGLVITLGLKCKAEFPTGRCELVFDAFVDEIPDGFLGVHCENVDCSGHCEMVLAGAETVGDIQCRCRF